MLKDFINDATNKLADISDSNLMTSAHARRNAADPASTIVAQNNAQTYVTPTFEGSDSAVAAPAVATQSQMPERDLSGFGDAAIDDINIDD